MADKMNTVSTPVPAPISPEEIIRQIQQIGEDLRRLGNARGYNRGAVRHSRET